MIWVNKSQKARQVPLHHSDITAVVAYIGCRYLFIALVYIPCHLGRRDKDEENLQSRLDIIKTAYKYEKAQCAELEMILSGDFNRWDTLSGASEIAKHSCQGGKERLINLMAEFNLQLLLPRGTVTYQRARTK